MNINQNTPNNSQHYKKPNDGTTTPPIPQPKPILIDNNPRPLPSVPWRAEALPSQRLANAIGKLDFIL